MDVADLSDSNHIRVARLGRLIYYFRAIKRAGGPPLRALSRSLRVSVTVEESLMYADLRAFDGSVYSVITRLYSTRGGCTLRLQLVGYYLAALCCTLSKRRYRDLKNNQMLRKAELYREVTQSLLDRAVLFVEPIVLKSGCVCCAEGSACPKAPILLRAFDD
jgi:hypothetical protein